MTDSTGPGEFPDKRLEYRIIQLERELASLTRYVDDIVSVLARGKPKEDR